MNIQPISIINQTNYRNNNRQNIAFGTSCLSFTKEEFLSLAQKRNELYPIYKNPQDLENFVMGFWTKIEDVKQRYENNKIVDVFISHNDKSICAMISHLGLDYVGRKEIKIVSENIFSGGEGFVRNIDTYVADLASRFGVKGFKS